VLVLALFDDLMDIKVGGSNIRQLDSSFCVDKSPTVLPWAPCASLKVVVSVRLQQHSALSRRELVTRLPDQNWGQWAMGVEIDLEPRSGSEIR